MKNRWPNLFIVGAAKAGTTSLHKQLERLPNIYMSPAKEPHYFSSAPVADLNYPGMVVAEQDYLKLFEQADKEEILGESSTSYLPFKESARKIHNYVPDAYIIISLRDPVERAFSHYLMARRAGHLDVPFFDAIQAELKGITTSQLGRMHLYLFSDKVEMYRRIFGMHQVKIIIFEDWVKTPQVILSDILLFLGQKESRSRFDGKIYNKYYERHIFAETLMQYKWFTNCVRKIVPKNLRSLINYSFINKQVPKPVIDVRSRDLLIGFYREDVARLENMLGRKLPWRNFQ